MPPAVITKGLGVIVVPVPEYEYQSPPQLFVLLPSSMSSSNMLFGVFVGVAVKVGVPAYGVFVGVRVGEPAGILPTKLTTLCAGRVKVNALPETVTAACAARLSDGEVT